MAASKRMLKGAAGGTGDGRERHDERSHPCTCCAPHFPPLTSPPFCLFFCQRPHPPHHGAGHHGLHVAAGEQIDMTHEWGRVLGVQAALQRISAESGALTCGEDHLHEPLGSHEYKYPVMATTPAAATATRTRP